MAGAKTHVSNFSHLAVHDEQLARLGALAELQRLQGGVGHPPGIADGVGKTVQELEARLRLEAKVTRLRECVNQLPAAMLAKAFRGELIPSSDIPVTELMKDAAAPCAIGAARRRVGAS